MEEGLGMKRIKWGRWKGKEKEGRSGKGKMEGRREQVFSARGPEGPMGL